MFKQYLTYFKNLFFVFLIIALIGLVVKVVKTVSENRNLYASVVLLRTQIQSMQKPDSIRITDTLAIKLKEGILLNPGDTVVNSSWLNFLKADRERLADYIIKYSISPHTDSMLRARVGIKELHFFGDSLFGGYLLPNTAEWHDFVFIDVHPPFDLIARTTDVYFHDYKKPIKMPITIYLYTDVFGYGMFPREDPLDFPYNFVFSLNTGLSFGKHSIGPRISLDSYRWRVLYGLDYKINIVK